MQRDVGRAAGSAAAEERAADDGVAVGVWLHSVDAVEERLIRGLASFGQSASILAHGDSSSHRDDARDRANDCGGRSGGGPWFLSRCFTQSAGRLSCG